MKILNIHGYHGCAENSAGKVLKQLGCEVISPYIDYDSQTPEEILEYLENIIRIYSESVCAKLELNRRFLARHVKHLKTFGNILTYL